MPEHDMDRPLVAMGPGTLPRAVRGSTVWFEAPDVGQDPRILICEISPRIDSGVNHDRLLLDEAKHRRQSRQQVPVPSAQTLGQPTMGRPEPRRARRPTSHGPHLHEPSFMVALNRLGSQAVNQVEHSLGMGPTADEVADEQDTVVNGVPEAFQELFQLIRAGVDVSDDDGPRHGHEASFGDTAVNRPDG